jgi:serine phosphatase RsbU (regulator of sigma subunit)
MLRFLLFSILLGWVQQGLGQQVLVFEEEAAPLSIEGKYLAVWSDSSKLISIKEMTQPRYKAKLQSLAEASNFGFSQDNYWFYFEIENKSSAPVLILEVDYPPLDYVSLFVENAQGQWEGQLLGDKVPFARRAIFHRNVAFEIPIAPGQRKGCYLKVNTDSSIQVPLYLFAPAAFHRDSLTAEILFGVFYGILSIMLLYNLFLFFALRQPSYIFYCLYILIYLLAQSSLNGHTFQYLWGDAIWWANKIVPLAICAFVSAAAIFAISFLNPRKFAPLLHKILIGFVVYYLACTLLALLAPYYLAVRFAAFNALLNSLLLLSAGLVVWYRGNKAAFYFILAWAVFLSGVLYVSLTTMGWVPNHPFLKYLGQVGAMIEIVLLSFALADRIHVIRKEKEVAQAATIEAVQQNEKLLLEQKDTLEKMVKIRTEEITVQNEELIQQREEILSQRDFIQQRNKELANAHQQVSQSIRYASQIQQALLPQEGHLERYFSQAFVINEPRDIVSGDFYWFYQEDAVAFLAVVDCTGHGVPGAFMSMIGYTLLKQIIVEKRVSHPPDILELLHEEVIAALRQRDTHNRDGMDVCLCRFERQGDSVQLSFSGAKRPLYVCQNAQWQELPATRRHIGGTQVLYQMPFEMHELRLYKGDQVLCITDGLTDISNKQRQKFGSRRLKALLERHSQISLKDLHLQLSQEMQRFAGQAQQRDDILVLAVEI